MDSSSISLTTYTLTWIPLLHALSWVSVEPHKSRTHHIGFAPPLRVPITDVVTNIHNNTDDYSTLHRTRLLDCQCHYCCHSCCCCPIPIRHQPVHSPEQISWKDEQQNDNQFSILALYSSSSSLSPDYIKYESGNISFRQ